MRIMCLLKQNDMTEVCNNCSILWNIAVWSGMTTSFPWKKWLVLSRINELIISLVWLKFARRTSLHSWCPSTHVYYIISSYLMMSSVYLNICFIEIQVYRRNKRFVLYCRLANISICRDHWNHKLMLQTTRTVA